MTSCGTEKPLQKNISYIDSMQSKLFRVASTQLAEKLTQIYKEERLKVALDRLKSYAAQDRKREGAKMLLDLTSRKLISEALIKWLKAVYFEEIMI